MHRLMAAEGTPEGAADLHYLLRGLVNKLEAEVAKAGGERDFNVPVQGGQQMYQALRSLGIDTQLIIYPNETHGISRPSYQKDRYQRYLAWYDKYVKGTSQMATGGTKDDN